MKVSKEKVLEKASPYRGGYYIDIGKKYIFFTLEDMLRGLQFDIDKGYLSEEEAKTICE